MLCILSWPLLSYSTMHYSIYNCHVRFSYALNGLHFPNPVLTSYFTCHSIFDNQGINAVTKLANRIMLLKHLVLETAGIWPFMCYLLYVSTAEMFI